MLKEGGEGRGRRRGVLGSESSILRRHMNDGERCEDKCS